MSIHNVTHVSARIISYIKFDTLEEIELSNTEQMQITMKIQEFYSCTENRLIFFIVYSKIVGAFLYALSLLTFVLIMIL